MAGRIRSRDWAATPLGEPAVWPAGLRAGLMLMLDTPIPACILWGTQAIQFWNDAWCRQFPALRSDAIGMPLRGLGDGLESDLAALHARTWREGAVKIDDRPIPVWRDGAMQDAWWRIRIVPIRAEDGQVLASFATFVETSAAMRVRHQNARITVALRRSEERHGFLLALSDALRPLRDSLAIRQAAMRRACAYLDCDGASYFDLAADPAEADQAARHDHRIPAPQPQLADFEAEALPALRAGRTILCADTRSGGAQTGARWASLGLRAFVAAPLARNGRLTGLMAVQSRTPRQWTADEVAILREVAARSWAEVTRVHAEAALQSRNNRHAFLLHFSDRLRAGLDADRIADHALRMLVDELDVDLGFIATHHPALRHVDVTHQHRRPGNPAVAPTLRRSDLPPGFAGRCDQTLVFDDLNDDLRPGADGRQRIMAGYRSLVIMPLRRDGNPIWLLAVATATPRCWGLAEIALLENIAERLWSRLARARAEAALHESESRLRQFAQASSSVLWMRDARTLVLDLKSPAFGTVYGRLCDDPGDDGLRCWLRMILPEDRRGVLKNLRLIRSGHAINYEFRIRRGDTGELRWIRNNDFPIRDGKGNVRWVAGLGTDITEAKLAIERHKIMTAELQHRTRNLLTVVRSLAERTVESTGSLPDFVQRFGERLAALSRVQGLLSHVAAGEPVSFSALLEAELFAHGIAAGAGQNVVLAGPAGVSLDADTIQVLALALHELATNAIKHGALSAQAPQGRLTIKWEVEATTHRRLLHIDWRETAVPVSDPDPGLAAQGFGRRMIERALPYQADAETRFRLLSDGLHCQVTIALPH